MISDTHGIVLETLLLFYSENNYRAYTFSQVVYSCNAKLEELLMTTCCNEVTNYWENLH